MDLLKNSRIRVLDAWSTGVTTHVSNGVDCSGAEDVTFLVSVPQTTTSVTVALQGSATTTLTDYAQLAYNSTNVSVSSTVTGGCFVIQVNHNIYRYLRVHTNSTGITSQGEVIAILSGIKNLPTTQASTEVVGSFHSVTPTTT